MAFLALDLFNDGAFVFLKQVAMRGYRIYKILPFTTFKSEYQVTTPTACPPLRQYAYLHRAVAVQIAQNIRLAAYTGLQNNVRKVFVREFYHTLALSLAIERLIVCFGRDKIHGFCFAIPVEIPLANNLGFSLLNQRSKNNYCYYEKEYFF
ncbi:MAG: hypothetical protein II751_05325 [Bacteroidales bacterium]|nr:hypothetical protein [Bacteroidales bacterium]